MLCEWGWAVAVEVQDVGSGATTRPQRETLIEAARRREIDCVLVWRLDRWDLAKDRDPLKDSDAYRRLNDARF